MFQRVASDKNGTVVMMPPSYINAALLSRRLEKRFSLRCHIKTWPTTCVWTTSSSSLSHVPFFPNTCHMLGWGRFCLPVKTLSTLILLSSLSLHHLTSSSWLSVPIHPTLHGLQPSYCSFLITLRVCKLGIIGYESDLNENYPSKKSAFKFLFNHT